jgi:hypothetical protein
MNSIGEQFSEARRQERLDRASGAILAAVIGDMRENASGGLAVDEYLLAPRRIITIALTFDERNAQMRLLAQRSGTPAPDDSPFGIGAQHQLLAATRAVLHDIGNLVISARPQTSDVVSRLVAYEKADVERIICQRYGERDLQHGLELAEERSKQGASGGNGCPKPKRKRAGCRKVPIDKILGSIENKRRKKMRGECSSDGELQDRMEAEFYSLSAEDLKAPVNDELGKLNFKPVSAKTISRSDKYKSWKQYRRYVVSPVSTAADYGSAFTQLGERTPTANDFVDAEVMANGLAKRSGRRLRSSSGRRSEHDRAADEWAKIAGVVLPPAE